MRYEDMAKSFYQDGYSPSFLPRMRKAEDPRKPKWSGEEDLNELLRRIEGEDNPMESEALPQNENAQDDITIGAPQQDKKPLDMGEWAVDEYADDDEEYQPQQPQYQQQPGEEKNWESKYHNYRGEFEGHPYNEALSGIHDAYSNYHNDSSQYDANRPKFGANRKYKYDRAVKRQRMAHFGEINNQYNRAKTNIQRMKRDSLLNAKATGDWDTHYQNMNNINQTMDMLNDMHSDFKQRHNPAKDIIKPPSNTVNNVLSGGAKAVGGAAALSYMTGNRPSQIVR